MKGFKDFLFRGNLIELAVAFIMGAAFAAVVTSFTGMIMDLIGKAGGVPDFSTVSVAGIGVGKFITALLSFLLISVVVYVAIVLPYNKIKARNRTEDATPTVTSEDLLTEIRDLLRAQRP
ncbi:large-conductance mechanosensitive channel protein MscL [Microlunatus panaciterrae]|uniref:Large conductance mechanosensitive channel n=1 Tax=Microlunatus panaciterrae TaxID=400768 RepID=A0ABS2RGK3_9ACTN|nr:large conductance mechanosensitive channel protein MscL [Microlunatus panaciterrae]MBM7798130.1 large conductance mechanosensitive channel [Microlunatus panaciterrae]